MKRPFICFSFVFAAVLLIFNMFAESSSFSFTIPLILACALFAVCAYLIFRAPRRLMRFFVIAAAVISACCCRVVYDNLVYSGAASLCGKAHYIHAAAVEDLQDNGNYGRVKVKIISSDDSPLNFKYKALLYLSKPIPDIKIGDSISGLFVAEIPENSLDFNSYTYNKAKGIFITLSCKESVTVTPCEKLPLTLLPTKFSYALNSVFSKFLSPEYAGFCSALITGDKRGINYTLSDSLSISGLSHVLSVSGMHISLLTGFLVIFFGKKFGSFIALPCILFFMAVSGFSPSVLRAGIMNIILTLSFILRRDKDTLSALASVLFLILIFNPYAVLDMGFLLSFGASLGILLFYQKLNRYLLSLFPEKFMSVPLLSHVTRFVISIFSSTAAATVFTIPLCSLFFGRISVVSPLANILVVPIISVLFFLAVFLGTFGLFSTAIASLIAVPVNIFVYCTLSMLGLFKKIPFSSFPVENFYFLVIIFIVYSVLCLCGQFPKQCKNINFPLFFCSLIMLGIIFSGMSCKNIYRLTLFNANGPAVAVRYRSKCILVDCGGEYNGLAARKIYNYLSLNGFVHADALILTNTDSEHAGAAVELLRNNAVKSVFMPYQNYSDRSIAKKIYLAAVENDIPVYPLAEKITEDGLSLIFHELTTGDTAAEIKLPNFSLLSAHSENVYVLNKQLAKSENTFDAVITDYQNFSHREELNKFCNAVRTKFIIVPDKVFDSELPFLGTNLYFLSKCGDMNIRVK